MVGVTVTDIVGVFDVCEIAGIVVGVEHLVNLVGTAKVLAYHKHTALHLRIEGAGLEVVAVHHVGRNLIGVDVPLLELVGAGAEHCTCGNGSHAESGGKFRYIFHVC